MLQDQAPNSAGHKPSVCVLGAGIVGVSCALELQRQGYRVTLLDRSEAVIETSYGNAGVLATSSVLPMNNARLWKSLLPMLTGKSPSLRYQTGYLLRNCGWMVRFMTHANEASDSYRITALSALVRKSIELHQQWLTQADSQQRLRATGWLKLYRTPESFNAAAYERRMLQDAGVDMQILSTEELQQLEPGLQQTYHRATWVRDAASVDNPAQVTLAYRQLFIAAGGQFRVADIRNVRQTSQGFELATASTELSCEKLVVALGPWSNDLLSALNCKLPMAYERGYHQHFSSTAEQPLSRPVHDVDGSYVLTPMEQGYRLTSGVELKERDAPASPVQLEAIIPSARQAFPLGQPLDQPWLGRRPTLPDALPAIGEVKECPGLWLATGHHHIGFSTGPATGQLVAQLMSGQDTDIAPQAFSPNRFS
ncbi:NAD(P)/FAD-dependent oxidoreductase [Aliamphritea hakodatensis]|uniref:NAD(P)/FAD-dependent oxidoreductase n=1 Tax=Aliamphritea hakodatensis TaxID=2895352 RepID=UPI0022FD7E4D|nr:FAD-dependent oxidoreductase [Aliamphritea hakodatensis]